MPRLNEETRAKRREHVLTSAWTCFAEKGFHATSMDDVIAATGMSSSAVYRHFRGKDELIRASAERGLGLVRDIFERLLAQRPTPSPADTLATLIGELRARTEHPRYDMTSLAVQAWAEALGNPQVRDLSREQYTQARERLTELAERWKSEGYLHPDADPAAAASVLFALMPGLIVSHHLITDITLKELTAGLTALGAALTGVDRV
ncbi:TetR/AcrR family transcriptional regulator [Streptomyces sp. 35G-GA-8]|uniref:TetR/AcrR family transcriptional regulator n=1 Tax=Streptomyces sp. 35G-GA-8 TaxID=2939434 RepID=UPI00201F67EC|nr:TetR/AcrR family transcriptional regulator [Streptomyces sp. 35G-GA-8]MCL7380556.1 TetR/AcrR family transcriptional regulator [Streptomyces sp. 35G-GA-8]